MTIRLENLNIDSDAREWLRADFPGAVDALHDETRRFDILAAVRHIMRERHDCTIIPIVRAFVMHPVNQWGHNAQIEVTYASRGYRAIYGLTLSDSGVSNVQCYMD